MYKSEEPLQLENEMFSSEEEPWHKKRKVHVVSPCLSLESCLTYDLVICFLVRLTRLEYAALSLTSKTYRSLVTSPDLYKARCLMGRTEKYIYVCLRTPLDTIPQWYILRPRKTLDASDLIHIPSPPSQNEEASSVVVLDWGIYVIGGLRKGYTRSATVWLLDCRTHKWRQLPHMLMPRAYAAAGVVDGKIYMIGGCRVDEFYSINWGEVFDPNTQTWEFLPPIGSEDDHDRYIHDTVVSDQKVYAIDGRNRTLYYSPSEGKWGRGTPGHIIGNPRDWCMIDNIVYCINRNGNIFWREPDELDWPQTETESMLNMNQVKGLESLQKKLFHSRVVRFGEEMINRWEQDKITLGIPPENEDGVSHDLANLIPGARLSNSGGNIVLFWDIVEGNHLEIWCAEISLEKRQGGEIWGNIEWENVVMTVDPCVGRYKVLYFASVTI